MISLTPPVYFYNEEVTEAVIEEFLRFQDWLLVNDEPKTDNRFFLELQAEFPDYFDLDTVSDRRYILQNPIEMAELAQELRQIMEEGVFLLDSPAHKELGTLYLQRELGLVTINTEDVRTLEDSFPPLIQPFLRVNCQFDTVATEEQIAKNLEAFTPSYYTYNKGDIILRKGFVVTPDRQELIKTISRQSQNLSVLHVLFCFLILLLAMGLTAILFQMIKPYQRVRQVYQNFLIVSFIYILSIVFLKLQFGDLPSFLRMIYFPAPLLTLLFTLLLGKRNGVILAFTLSVLTIALGDITLGSFVFLLFSSIAAALLVQEIYRRIHIIQASLFLSAIQTLLLLAGAVIDEFSLNLFRQYFLYTLISGFAWGLMATSFLPILEHLLNWPTPFRLRELADLSAPIFKRMLNLAPGTFSHSVNVANLAESACREVKANSLLARVGAYYHDIGKIDQAELFIENQKGDNKHDNLKPSMSATILKSHVKIGVEKAQELGLPKEVVDIIAQHHGRGLIHFFYDKAKNANLEISRDDFLYPGPNPQTREAAIVMLADTVEAATRTLKKPTVTKLEKFVWKLLTGRLEEGLLNNSRLTFNDLEIIKDAFVKILAGYFHTRIEYPKKEGADE